MDLHLDGRVAIVTGASRGIGRAIAEHLACEGARVLAVARESTALHELAHHASGRIEPLACDVTEMAAVRNLPEQAMGQFGRLDIVVNNAGGAITKPFADLTDADWDWHLAINVTAPSVLSRAAGRYLIQQGSGKIINMLSTAAVRAASGIVAYAAAKGAALQLTRALAVEWGPYGIQVNAIGPGATATEANRPLLEGPREILEAALAGIPGGRLGQPEDVARLTCFLASPASDHITGQVIMIDGGATAGIPSRPRQPKN